jgi:hypothetical protein
MGLKTQIKSEENANTWTEIETNNMKTAALERLRMEMAKGPVEFPITIYVEDLDMRYMRHANGTPAVVIAFILSKIEQKTIPAKEFVFPKESETQQQG